MKTEANQSITDGYLRENKLQHKLCRVTQQTERMAYEFHSTSDSSRMLSFC